MHQKTSIFIDAYYHSATFCATFQFKYECWMLHWNAWSVENMVRSWLQSNNINDWLPVNVIIDIHTSLLVIIPSMPADVMEPILAQLG